MNQLCYLLEVFAALWFSVFALQALMLTLVIISASKQIIEIPFLKILFTNPPFIRVGDALVGAFLQEPTRMGDALVGAFLQEPARMGDALVGAFLQEPTRMGELCEPIILNPTLQIK